jgi:two-component system, cell cycle sensor histidine kinase and response regulator CckA
MTESQYDSRDSDAWELLSAISQGTDNSDIGVMVTLEQENAVFYVNGAMTRLTGYEQSSLAERGLSGLLPKAERERLTWLRRARMNGEPVPRVVQTQLISKSGAEIPAEASFTQVIVHGRVAEVAFFTDLSERKLAEYELKSSEARFRQLVDSAPDGVVILNGTRFLFVNPAAAELLCAGSADSLVGQNWDRFLEPESARKARQLVSRMVTAQDFPRGSREFTTKDQRAIEVSSIPIQYEGVGAVLAFARDVTERNAIQARLVQADRLAAVGMLAAGVAHEINNPLAYVLLNLKYLEKELPKLAQDPGRLDGLLKHLEDANHGARRVQAIVKDLRVFARTDGGTAGPVDVIQVLEAALTSTAHELNPRAQVVRHYEDVALVNGTASRLEQVFVNLLVNAAQCLDEKRPGESQQSEARHRVVVSVLRGAPGRVRVCVQDTGPGIAPDLVERVFDPFFTTKRAGVGTGLGLPICRSIVENYDGSIHVERVPSGGTRMVVELAESTEDRVPISSLAPPSSAGSPDPKKRLLIIDDERSVAQILGQMLGPQFDVTVCCSGQEALALVRETIDFEVILCDIMMPEMSGVELYDLLRERQAGVEQKIIFMTGGALLPNVAEFLTRVQRPKIEKPFDMMELRRAIRKVSCGTSA